MSIRPDIAANRLFPYSAAMDMKVVDVIDESQDYAQDVQEALHAAMRRHAETVGFESQIAILAVAIGAILNQLPDYDRDHFMRIFIRNLEESPQFSRLIRLQ